MNLDEMYKLVNKYGLTNAAEMLGMKKQTLHYHISKHPKYKPKHPPKRTTEACPKCGSDRTKRNGKRDGHQQYRCGKCQYGWRTAPPVLVSEVAEKLLKST